MAALKWRPISELPPGSFTRYLYRVGDLYPVVGWGDPDKGWVLEEGGGEDRKDRQYPTVGGKDWQPTHFSEINHDELPTIHAPAD